MKRTSIIPFLSGAILCFVATTGVRYAAYTPPPATHFHANYSVYINHLHLDLSNEKYMEPETRCTVSGAAMPEDRVHQHDGKGDQIHIHTPAVTWGDFFANIRFTLTSTELITDTGQVYTNDSTHTLRYVINGRNVVNPVNIVIGDRDRLLVSYSDESEAATLDRFQQVPSTAAALDATVDPASCSGSGTDPLTVKERLRKALL